MTIGATPPKVAALGSVTLMAMPDATPASTAFPALLKDAVPGRRGQVVPGGHRVSNPHDRRPVTLDTSGHGLPPFRKCVSLTLFC